MSEEKEINPPSASATVICATPSPNVCAVSASDNDDDLQFIKPLLDTLPDSVTDEERQEIQSLLLKNSDLFARHEYDVGLTSLVTYKLETVGPVAPASEPQRRHPISLYLCWTRKLTRCCQRI